MKKSFTFNSLLIAFLFILSLRGFGQSITWTETQPAGDFNKAWCSSSMSSDGTKLIAGTINGRLYISSDGGNNWAETQPAGATEKNWYTTSMNSDGTKLIVGNKVGRLYISTDSGNNWDETQPAGAVDKNWYTTSMNSDGTKLIAGELPGRLYISTDGGNNWTETQPTGDVDRGWATTSMSSDGTKLIVGVSFGRLYISTDGGNNWGETQPAGDVGEFWYTTSMNSDGTKLIAGANSGRLYISTDGGNNWGETQPAGDIDRGWRSSSMSSYGMKLIVGVNPGRLYISTDGGNNWSETQPLGAGIDMSWTTTSMSSDASKLIAGINGHRLYLNNEPMPVELTSFTADVKNKMVQLNWQTATEVNNYGFEIQKTAIPASGTAFTDLSAGAVRNSAGDGWVKGTSASSSTSSELRLSASWETLGFVNGHGNSNSPKYYSFTDNDVQPGEYSYRLKQIDFDGAFEYSETVDISVNILSPKFTLEQNYPNPFNPVTTIKFIIPTIVDATRPGGQDFASTTLKVYDILGRELATLVNEKKSPGVYEVEFNASKLSSGIYYYTLSTNNYRGTKKMLLLK